MTFKVFISYRRDDAAAAAGRIHDRLAKELGNDVTIFMDVDDIPLGEDFFKVLRAEVGRCDVLLAVIGPKWLDARDDRGNRRLDIASDPVRIEIATALERAIPVIPILLEGTRIPKEGELPQELARLSSHNGLDLRHASFHKDLDTLLRSLRTRIQATNRGGDAKTAFIGGKRKWVFAIVAVIVAAIVALIIASVTIILPVVQTVELEGVPEPSMTGALNDTEKKITQNTGYQIQRNLCVEQTGTFDARTREAVRQAKLGANQTGTYRSPFANIEDRILSAAEAQIFLNSGYCQADASRTNRGYQTAFEKFAFPGEVEIRALQNFLAACDPDLRERYSGRFDDRTRDAIRIAKSKLIPTRKAELTDYSTGTLNDKSYNAIALTCR